MNAALFHSEYTGRRAGILFEVTVFLLCVLFFGVIVHKRFMSTISMPIGEQWIEIDAETGDYVQVGSVNVLVMGIDSVEGTHRSDTIFILGVNPSKARIYMLSIPRDTRVIIDGKARKINEVLPRYGRDALCALLEDLLGIRINRYVAVDFKAFTDVVDTIGGVDINVERDMNYDDNWGNLHIHFKKGMNHMNGEQSLNYVRFRADAAADLGRIKRQQEFMKVILTKLMNPSIVVKLPQLIDKAYSYVETNFLMTEIFTVVKGFSTYNIRFEHSSMPGEARYIDKVSYFIPYKDKAAALGASYFSDLASVELMASFSADLDDEDAGQTDSEVLSDDPKGGNTDKKAVPASNTGNINEN